MLNLHTSEAEEAESDGINISPLIDIVFILLLFFVVTSVFVEETGVEVSKPESAQAVALDRQSILFALTADGRVFHGGAEVGLQGIAPTLARLGATPDQPVILQADAQTTTQLLLAALDEVKGAGLSNVRVSTIKKSQ
jgi:biopolymer transport protein ExbD